MMLELYRTLVIVLFEITAPSDAEMKATHLLSEVICKLI